MAEIPLRGDRDARDSLGYPSLHASDLEANTPVQHMPTDADVGQVPSWDGDKWIPDDFLTPAALAAHIALPNPHNTAFTDLIDAPGVMRRKIIYTFAGDLEVGENPFKIYNRFGMNQRIYEVFLSAAGAPTGANVIVDIHSNQSGSDLTVYTDQDDRPVIVAGEVTGYSSQPFDWPANTYLRAIIDQIGSSVPGDHLVVHVAFSPSESGGDIQPLYGQGV
jgi:hypothetical protein